jgi:CAAD domains of cyanobacterial aminoacyl-tRNA synthetase
MTEKFENNTSPSIATADRPTVLDVNTVAPGTLLQLPTSDNPIISPEVKEQVENVIRFLSTFPDYFNGLGGYRKPLTTVGLVLVAGLGVAVADGVLARLNTIPLFAPTFELIGLGFTGWVLFRYLLYADTRQELLQAYDHVKERITGSEEESDLP